MTKNPKYQAARNKSLKKALGKLIPIRWKKLRKNLKNK
jgi:hypothetical protein